MTIQTTIREFIEKKFRPQLSVQRFDDDTPLFSSGVVDSFGVLELIAFLEDTFKVEIDTTQHELNNFDTVNTIAGLVATLSGTSGEH